MNYNPSTLGRIGDVVAGIHVETPTFLNATYIIVAQVTLFNVKGRIRLYYFGIEAVTQWSNDATTIKFSYDASTPAIAVVDLCTASGALTNLAIGKRVAVLGDALATGALESANSGVSLATNPLDIGCYGGVGVLTVTGAAAAQTGATATSRAQVLYAPLTEGAYVKSAI